MKKIMRRIAAVLMTAALMAGLSLTAFAEGASTEAGSFNFNKVYESTDEETFPSETLEFTVTADSNNPDSTAITVGDDNTFEVTGLTNEIPVNYPSFSKVGVYRYTIKENEGSSQGVTYDTETEINIAILVAYNEEHTGLVVTAGVEKADPDAEKVDTLTNTYDLGGNPPGPGGDPAGRNGFVRVEGRTGGSRASGSRAGGTGGSASPGRRALSAVGLKFSFAHGSCPPFDGNKGYSRHAVRMRSDDFFLRKRPPCGRLRQRSSL